MTQQIWTGLLESDRVARYYSMLANKLRWRHNILTGDADSIGDRGRGVLARAVARLGIRRSHLPDRLHISLAVCIRLFRKSDSRELVQRPVRTAAYQVDAAMVRGESHQRGNTRAARRI